MTDHRPAVRNSMIAALSACADSGVRARARRFLSGLSSDELQFLAEFIGACILESSEDRSRVAASLEWRHCQWSGSGLLRSDHEHKMILLREFLERSRDQLVLSGDAGPAAA